MFREVESFLSSLESATTTAAPSAASLALSERELQLVACTLLLQTAFVDLSIPADEERAIFIAMSTLCDLSEPEMREMLDIAELSRIYGADFDCLAAAINAHLNLGQKLMLYATVWHVVKADRTVHEQELKMATKLGQLLQLSVEQEIEARRIVIHGRLPF